MRYLFLFITILIFIKSFSQNDNDDIKSLINELKQYSYQVSVSSIGNKIDDVNKSYFLFLSEKIENQNNKLLMRDYLSWIEKTLSLVGYNRIIDTINNRYNYKIYVEWSISSPNTRNVTLPGFNLPTTSTTKVSQDYFSGDLNISTTKSNLSIPPQSIQVTTYNKNLNLICRNPQNEDLWFVSSNSVGRSNDLRLILKVLSFVTMKYVEKDSKTGLEIDLDGKLKKEFLNYVKMVLQK